MSKIDIILDLAQKKLEAVPEDVLNLRNLKMLYLEGNQLSVLPDELFVNLPKLVWLDLRNNKLKTLPVTLANHPCLETLLLRDNEIQVLPYEIGFVPNLKVLQISGNPIVYPKNEVIQDGLQSIVNFLRAEHASTIIMNNNDTHPKNEINEVQEIYAEQNSPRHNITMPVNSIKKINKARKAPSRSRGSRLLKAFSKLSFCKDNSVYNRNKYIPVPTARKNEHRVEEQYVKELWLKKLKEIMNRQDEILQREKNYEALKNWRRTMRQHPRKQQHYDFKAEVPYDFDPEYERIPSRRDLQRQPDNTKRTISQHKPKSINVEKLISDIVESLKIMERQRDTEDLTPRSQMDQAGREIKRILELQKRLSMMKLKN